MPIIRHHISTSGDRITVNNDVMCDCWADICLCTNQRQQSITLTKQRCCVHSWANQVLCLKKASGHAFAYRANKRTYLFSILNKKKKRMKRKPWASTGSSTDTSVNKKLCRGPVCVKWNEPHLHEAIEPKWFMGLSNVVRHGRFTSLPPLPSGQTNSILLC